MAGTVEGHHFVAYETGLPLRSMESHVLAVATPDGITVTTVGSWNTGTFAGKLPLHPIWRRFAVDTIFYAALLWLLTLGSLKLRGFIRQRRGLCPACAYPMGESATCTECGKPLPPRPQPCQ